MLFTIIILLVNALSGYSVALRPRQSAQQQLCSTIQGPSGPADCSQACTGAYEVLQQLSKQSSITTNIITEACDTTGNAGAAVFFCAVCFATGVGDNNQPWANSATVSSDQTFQLFADLAGVCAVYDESGAAQALQAAQNDAFSSVPSIYNICGAAVSTTPVQSTTTPIQPTTTPAQTTTTPSFPPVPMSSTTTTPGPSPTPVPKPNGDGPVFEVPPVGLAGLVAVVGLLAELMF